MQKLAQSACLVLLAGWIGSDTSPAQTNLPAPGNTNRPTVVRRNMRRFSGKILSVDSKAKTITLMESKLVIGISDTTTISKANTTKSRKRSTFADLAADQLVTGMYHQDSDGKWQADTLIVGDPRQPLDQPVPKTFVAPVRTNTGRTNAVRTNAVPTNTVSTNAVH
jgi:hypothetical protein